MLTSLVPYVVFVEVISGGARREHGWMETFAKDVARTLIM